MFSEEHLYSIALRKCAFVGDSNFKKLVENAGSAEEVWKTPKLKLQKINGIGQKISAEIGEKSILDFAEKELKFCEKNGINIRLRHKSELPDLLSECDDPPSVLYEKGKFPDQLNAVSIVGTRNCTAYGKHFIEDLLEELKNHGIVTISGLALGADAEVHEKSLQKNIATVGVLAHGFHTFYPSKNKLLSERILENDGALFTEFNTSQKPDRENFIQRNRIIAGLSSATILVESAFGGGSISTVTFANGYNRDVYALPGKITDKYSQGCNQMIAHHKAFTISTIKDLVENLGFNKPKESTGELFPTSEIKLQLTEKQELIYNFIKQNPYITLDELSDLSEFATYKILPLILELELSGHIKTFSGRQFLVI